MLLYCIANCNLSLDFSVSPYCCRLFVGLFILLCVCLSVNYFAPIDLICPCLTCRFTMHFNNHGFHWYHIAEFINVSNSINRWSYQLVRNDLKLLCIFKVSIYNRSLESYQHQICQWPDLPVTDLAVTRFTVDWFSSYQIYRWPI